MQRGSIAVVGAYSSDLANAVPYVVAVVRMDQGPYLHTRVVGVAPEVVKSGMRVRVRRGKDDAFPSFQPEA